MFVGFSFFVDFFYTMTDIVLQRISWISKWGLHVRWWQWDKLKRIKRKWSTGFSCIYFCMKRSSMSDHQRSCKGFFRRGCKFVIAWNGCVTVSAARLSHTHKVLNFITLRFAANVSRGCDWCGAVWFVLSLTASSRNQKQQFLRFLLENVKQQMGSIFSG